ncbi:ankyrin repeat protein, putative [Trichomonas vaginalis G3]|uniref:Ankyrin repeat protein, putative n=1 Tax=Trichomonas vaginalis (strain ATCC PRA-98 / G3) TaxID=412133 RepID=A2DEK8_TRIV3|nr:ankyrin repeat and SOCS box-containing protein 4 family [Trichomonas vaginalis G3]EAY21135.1 ankyrin repeat protein, putative [Trichomonas vaginalis G3]KAI5522340.1 ankyrin repeat and SOCS box-containing protein 4 family [Trichomonas vaginalis G3]|eukprot:XP_001582121.1 ankyrin repeat protein [Trichomonas vaginalis G3]
MSDQDAHPKEYIELRNTYKYYIDSYIALYQLKTEKSDELNKIYKMIKAELIDSKKHLPENVIKDILNIIPYNNRYAKSYLFLAKLLYDEYHIENVNKVEDISNFLFYKEYGIKLDKSVDFEDIYLGKLDIHTENTIYRAIMHNDLIKFISFIETKRFNKYKKLNSRLYPFSMHGYSLLELCCYHGAVDCFKFLRTKFKSNITETCLELSFLGRNQEIMSECLKYQKPNKDCMIYAIISHNIDFVTFLMNEYKIKIDLENCGIYNNLESYLVYFDQTHSINYCLINSGIFAIPSLCEYFLSNGASINKKYIHGFTALHYAAKNNYKEMTECLLSHGIKINEKNYDGFTALHYAAKYNSEEIAELLLSYGANVDEKDNIGYTALHYAAKFNSKETAEVLLLYGADIDEKDNRGCTPLHYAAKCNGKETAEILLSYGANIEEKNQFEETPLHIAADHNYKEMAELLLSYGANIEEKNQFEETPLHIAAEHDYKEMVELLLSHNANINEKDNIGSTVLHYTATNNCKEIAGLLLSHGANINEKDNDGFNALHYAAKYNSKITAEFLLSHGANIDEKDNIGRTALHYAAINNS